MIRSVLITGASSGVGYASAVTFARAGYRVFATYRGERDRAKLDEIPGVYPVCMDVTVEEDILDAYRKIESVTGEGGLYAIVNNAGITYTAPFEYADERRARQVMEVNLMAPFRITRAFLPLLKRFNTGSGPRSRVINIASWAGQVGQPFISFYNASKAAIMALSESMLYDLGLLGIHVVLASPGITATPLLEKTTRDGTDNLSTLPEEARAFYEPYFEHLSAMGERSRDSKLFSTSEAVARRLLGIANARRPRFKYNLAADAVIIDKLLTRFVPFAWRLRMNRRMFGLGSW